MNVWGRTPALDCEPLSDAALMYAQDYLDAPALAAEHPSQS